MARVSMYIWSTSVLLVISLVSAFFIFYSISPKVASNWQFILLYSTVFLVVTSAGTLIGFGGRALLWRKGSRFIFIRTAVRQGIYLGFFAVITMILQASGVLNLWTGVLLLVIFILIELYSQ